VSIAEITLGSLIATLNTPLLFSVSVTVAPAGSFQLTLAAFAYQEYPDDILVAPRLSSNLDGPILFDSDNEDIPALIDYQDRHSSSPCSDTSSEYYTARTSFSSPDPEHEFDPLFAELEQLIREYPELLASPASFEDPSVAAFCVIFLFLCLQFSPNPRLREISRLFFQNPLAFIDDSDL
jgi:hypothetical protein